jgi:hypothetical protein
MATLDQIKDADERSLAARHVPADVLKRLSAAELRYRARHAKHIIDRARETPVRESQQALSVHAAKILASVPAVEFIHERAKRADLQQHAPSHLQPHYHAMVSGYNEANDYPPGLVAACDQYLQGREVMGDNELAHVAGEAVNAYGIRSSKP